MHRNKDVIRAVKDLGWTMQYNAPYSSQWHCIETAFSSVKRAWKQGLLDADFGLTEHGHEALVRSSIMGITPELVQRVAQRSFEDMRAWLAKERDGGMELERD